MLFSISLALDKLPHRNTFSVYCVSYTLQLLSMNVTLIRAQLLADTTEDAGIVHRVGCASFGMSIHSTCKVNQHVSSMDSPLPIHC